MEIVVGRLLLFANGCEYVKMQQAGSWGRNGSIEGARYERYDGERKSAAVAPASSRSVRTCKSESESESQSESESGAGAGAGVEVEVEVEIAVEDEADVKVEAARNRLHLDRFCPFTWPHPVFFALYCNLSILGPVIYPNSFFPKTHPLPSFKAQIPKQEWILKEERGGDASGLG